MKLGNFWKFTCLSALCILVMLSAYAHAFNTEVGYISVKETFQQIGDVFADANPIPSLPEYPEDEQFDENGQQTNQNFFTNAGRFFNYIGSIFVFIGKLIVWIFDEIKMVVQILFIFLPKSEVTVV